MRLLRYRRLHFQFCIFLCILSLAGTVSLFVFFGHRLLRKVSPLFPFPHKTCRESWITSFDSVRQCLISKWTRENRLIKIDQDIDQCVGWRLRRRVNAYGLKGEYVSADSTTYFIPPKNENVSGTVVTLGIRDEIDIEHQIRRKLPNWRFYAIDKNSTKGSLYESVGAFYNFSLTNSSSHFGIAERETRDRSFVINFIDFVSKVIKRFSLEYLLINSATLAIYVLPQFVRSGPLEQSGIAVCQVTVINDAASPTSTGKENLIDQIVRSLVLGRTWLPLQAIRLENGRRKLFLINIASLYCLDKFFSKCQ